MISAWVGLGAVERSVFQISVCVGNLVVRFINNCRVQEYNLVLEAQAGTVSRWSKRLEEDIFVSSVACGIGGAEETFTVEKVHTYL